MLSSGGPSTGRTRRRSWPRGSPRSWRRSASEGFDPPGLRAMLEALASPDPRRPGPGRDPARLAAERRGRRPPARRPARAPWTTPAPSSTPSARSATRAPYPPLRTYATRKLLSRRRSAVEALRNLGDHEGLAAAIAQGAEQLPGPVRAAFDAIAPQDGSAGAVEALAQAVRSTRRPASGPGARHALRDRHAGRGRRGPRGAVRVRIRPALSLALHQEHLQAVPAPPRSRHVRLAEPRHRGPGAQEPGRRPPSSPATTASSASRRSSSAGPRTSSVGSAGDTCGTWRPIDPTSTPPPPPRSSSPTRPTMPRSPRACAARSPAATCSTASSGGPASGSSSMTAG